MGGKKRSARAAAIAILRAWEESGLPLAVVRDRVFARKHERPADPRDRALANRLLFGLMRCLNRIDHHLATRSKKPLDRLDGRVRAALRLGLFELSDFGRGRPARVVNETVAALRESGAPGWLCGYVNGVLRAFVRHGIPRAPLSPALETGHPQWILDRWQARFGPDGALALARTNNRRADLCLRARPGGAERLLARLEEAGIAARPGGFAPDAVELPGFSGRVEDLPGYTEGAFAVMDQAAQLVSHLALAGNLEGDGGGQKGKKGKKAQKILDGCAGVGGKSAHLADLAPGARVVAVEPEPARRRLCAENLARLGLAGRVEIRPGTVADLAGKGEKSEKFDLVLIDAPCSGLGVIRRHPDIRWNRRPEDIAAMAGQQAEILAAAAGLVAPGGTLVYAVCSFEPEETVAVVRDFLGSHPRLRLEDAARFLSALPLPEGCLKDGFFLSRPDLTGMDGFFAARLALDSRSRNPEDGSR